MTFVSAVTIAAAITLSVSQVNAEDLCAGALKQKDDALLAVIQENALLKEKASLVRTPALNASELNSRLTARLREIIADLKVQRQAMSEFQGYVTWMSGSIAGYSKYIEAGSIAAGFAKVLPIPYAGQAGMFTKFVSHFTLSLSSASRSITTYLATSRQFIDRMDNIEKHPDRERELQDLALFADDQLIREMTDLQAKLSTTSELSTSALSFMEGVNHYAQSSDEYLAKAKSLVRKGDAEKKEKSFLAESVAGLKNRAGDFNARLKGFDDSVRKDIPLIKSLGTYLELLAFLKWRQAEEGVPSETVPLLTAPSMPQQ